MALRPRSLVARQITNDFTDTANSPLYGRTIDEMDFQMTIRTQRFEIVIGMVLIILVAMMHREMIWIFIAAAFTTQFTLSLNRNDHASRSIIQSAIKIAGQFATIARTKISLSPFGGWVFQLLPADPTCFWWKFSLRVGHALSRTEFWSKRLQFRDGKLLFTNTALVTVLNAKSARLSITCTRTIYGRFLTASFSIRNKLRSTFAASKLCNDSSRFIRAFFRTKLSRFAIFPPPREFVPTMFTDMNWSQILAMRPCPFIPTENFAKSSRAFRWLLFGNEQTSTLFARLLWWLHRHDFRGGKLSLAQFPYSPGAWWPGR